MRLDENGNECPSTLVEYRDMCAAIAGKGCKAVQFLERKIEANGGKDDEVVVPDLEMRQLLYPMLGISYANLMLMTLKNNDRS